MNERDAMIDQIAKEVLKENLQEISADPFWPNENNPNNPTFSEESAQELQSLAEQWQHIINESDRWFAKYAHPLFAQCRTIDEWKRVRGAMLKPIDKEGQFLELPGNMQVSIAYAADFVCQKTEKVQVQKSQEVNDGH
jgi:hypothetical protein